MDAWALGSLAAAVLFVLFLIVKLRPDLSAEDAPSQPRRPGVRRERRLWRGLQQLPRPAQQRILAKLEQHLKAPPLETGAASPPDSN